MDVYGNALMESKREANSKVVRLLLKPVGNPPSLLQQKGRCLVSVLNGFKPFLCPAIVGFSGVRNGKVVAGVGFEPTTFGL